MRTQKGTQLREKRIFNASVDLQEKMDKILLDFADELVVVMTFENIEKLFLECAKDAVTYGTIGTKLHINKMIKRKIR